MVIIMHEGATEEQIQHVIDRVIASGFDVHRSTGAPSCMMMTMVVKPQFL